MRRWRVIEQRRLGTTYVGPIQYLRPGMLSYAATLEALAMIPPGDMGGAMLVCTEEIAGQLPPLVNTWICADELDVLDMFAGQMHRLGIEYGGTYPREIRASYVDSSARIGSRPFKTFGRGARAHLASGLGGVILEEHVTIGAGACIDRGIFGEYTELGRNVHVDNLVHVGHSVRVGADTTIAAGCILGGWAELGAGCRLETGVTVFKGVSIGAGSRIGSGSLVTRDVPAGVLAYGRPARIVREL